MQRVQVGHHSEGVVAHHDGLDSVRIENRLRQAGINVIRESTNDEEAFALFHYLISTVAGFCGEIMRCANGVPGNMIHGPPSTGFSLIPVVWYVA